MSTGRQLRACAGAALRGDKTAISVIAPKNIDVDFIGYEYLNIAFICEGYAH
jgi:hypothetical protein